ncbi:ATPase AAA domain-containing protein 5 [Mactra antiquata]
MMEKELQSKLSKNKTDVVEKHGKNKKISDFFTTPDKNVDKQKQKSLLQFFAKSSNNVASTEAEAEVIDSVKSGEKEVTTPSNSDKENNDNIIDIETVEDTESSDAGNKSVKKPLFLQNSGCSNKEKSDKSSKRKGLKPSDSNGKKNNKSKKNNAHKVTEDSFTESVILLSDSNSSCDPVVEGKESTNLEGKHHKKSKSKHNCKSTEDTKIDCNGDVEEVNDQTCAENTNKYVEKLDRDVKEKNTDHRIEKIVEIMPDEKMKDLCSSVGQKDGDPLKCKKTALKGKDMLNLLKEIQSTEEEVCVKKKKHKKKHKHKDKLEVDVHEITNTECVRRENEGSDYKRAGKCTEDEKEIIDGVKDDNDELNTDMDRDKKKTKPYLNKESKNVEMSKDNIENKCGSGTQVDKEVVTVDDEHEDLTMEVSSKKKKHKKKHKHKHKDKTDAEVQEITNSECVTVENEGANSKTEDKGIVDKKEIVDDVDNDNEKLTLETHKDKKKRKLQLNKESKSIKEPEDVSENTSDMGTEVDKQSSVQDEPQKLISKKHKDKKTKLLSLVKENKNNLKSKQKSVKMTGKPKGEKSDTLESKSDNKEDGLSYGSFEKNFETDEKVTAVKTTPGKEMSYSDYLKLMEQKNLTQDKQEAMDCDDVDILECENIIVDDLPHDDIDGVIPECIDVEKKVDSKSDRKKDISTFFKVMTSTPDGSKKAGKNMKDCSESNSVDTDIKNIELGKNSEEGCKTGKSGKKSSKYEEIVTIVDETVNDHKNEKLKHLNGKHKQATLSFGKNGLTVAKPIATLDENPVIAADEKVVVNDKAVNDNIVPVKKKRGRPRKIVVESVDLNMTDSSVFATPDKVSKTCAMNKKRKMDTSSSIDSDFSDRNDRRRSLRKRYKVEAFQMDADRKTPIKIKLKRCPKSSSSGEDAEKSIKVRKPETNRKQTAAQALLEKAKKRKIKKHSDKKDKTLTSKKLLKRKEKESKKSRNESNSSEDSVTRRSSRLEGRVMASMEEVSLENIVISSSDDDGDDYKGRKKGKKKKKSGVKTDMEDTGEKSKKGNKLLNNAEVSTPTKDKIKKVNSPMKNSPKNSKKSGVKLAPMFLKGKGKNVENSPKKPVLDPEQAKQRQQFLMSGVPEELRKQTAARMASLVDADYPPFPRDNHVIQMPTDTTSIKPGLCNVWELRNVDLPLRCLDEQQNIQPKSRFTGDLMNSYQSTFNNLKQFKSFSCHDVLMSTVIDKCLQEIQSLNPLYPTEVMYKSLLEMKKESDKPPVKSESMLKTDMKGILSGCDDMVVIDDDEDKMNKKQNDLKKEDVDSKDKLKSAGCSMLWTEKYCPIKSSDILGNAGMMKKLKVWLTEWKQILDREARKARKLLMKKNRGKQLQSKKDDDDDLWDDDSDFDMNSDDSDDDDSLCNTVLLTGPHGCGKTSSVYALALELGFKVHEVNTSSCRSGKQILSQLQEATQSHQVSSLGSLTPRKNVDQTKGEGSKMPQSFTNLFKKAAVSSQDKADVKDGGKKRKRNKSEKEDKKTKKRKNDIKHNTIKSLIEDSNSQMAANCIKISSTTLILFDEVDVVLDEDKGFLSAIQTFMSKTKIPIILTTADPGFTHTFDGRYEVMNMKRPSVVSVSSHLQVISLVENVRLEHETLLEMVQLYGGDVRKCLTALQFMLLSGGGHCQKQKAFEVSNFLKTVVARGDLDMEASQSSNDASNMIKSAQAADDSNTGSKMVNDDDDDFVVLKPLKKRRRVLDDDSNSVDSFSHAQAAKSNNIVTGEKTAIEEKVAIDSSSCCTIHSVGLETMLKKGHLSVVDTLSQGLKSKSSLDIKDMICTSCRFQHSTNTDIYYNNLHHLLPFNYKIVDSVCKGSQGPSEVNNKTRKRIKHFEGLYDSECSNDAMDIPKIASSDVDDLSKTCKDTETDNSKFTKEENKCLIESLSGFGQFYETLSCLDVIESRDKMKMMDSIQCQNGLKFTGHLVAGVDNMLPQFERFCETDLETNEIYCSEIKTRSMCQFYHEMEAVKQSVESLSNTNTEFEENFVLPVMKPSDRFSIVDQSRVSMSSDYRRAYENINDSLPTITHSQHRSKHLDYLPCLRQICRTEQCRQISNAKRRFHHYLDAITLPLKDRTMSTLATTFS